MGETINLLFRSRENGTYEVQIKENTSRRMVTGNFVPPYTGRQLTALQKRLNTLDSGYQELREIGYRLFQALCDIEENGKNTSQPETSEPSVRTVLRTTIQRTLKRRGTVALTFSFASGCDEFVRYPWELLHNGSHFLLVSGIFTLTRALVRPEVPIGCELPVRPPFRVLYMGSSPTDCEPLETEQSFGALERGLAPLIETNQIFLDRLEPPSFDELVRYLNSYGGVGTLDDSETATPCYVVHFDGHGAYGRLCPSDGCGTVNEANAHTCIVCATSLAHVKPQTYLCFCNEFGCNQFIDTQTLRDLFITSDVRLAVFSACETATVAQEPSRRRQQRAAVDATLATALVTAQVPAVIAMPFALQDQLSPIFIYHFYEALADGRTLEEALSRARQALLSRQQMSWFIPVLYRHVAEGQEAPVPLLISEDAPEEYAHPLEHLNPSSTFVGRERELGELDELLTAAMGDHTLNTKVHLRLHAGTHHIALTGSPGIGKSALTCELVRRHHQHFPGGIVGVSLEGNKTFGDALLEIIHQMRKTPSLKTPQSVDAQHREHFVVGTYRSLANRELNCLLILDGFEEVKDHTEQETWLRFLCSLPQEVVVIVTSRSNPETMMIDGSAGGMHCRWYEYHIGNMTDEDLLKLFADLAEASGLDQRIHLDDEKQQTVLREICALLDGYPLGAELIFGATRSIGGKLFAPEAATRSLEEIRDELYSTPLAGILAVLEVAYNRLTPPTRLLLSYLAAFKLPFSREQIMLLVAPETLATANDSVHLLRDHDQRIAHVGTEPAIVAQEVVPTELAQNWRGARDELVQASFIQFDGRLYTIHPQVRLFALSHLPIEERRRVHRVVAAYYYTLPHPSADEWFAAFEHLENASEEQDLQEAITVAVRAFHALDGHGHIHDVLAMLRRANGHASRLGIKAGEGQIQCCLGTLLRRQGKYPEAEGCLRSSLEFHKAQQQRNEAGWALHELALLFREESDFQQAGTYAQEALDLFREVGDTTGEAWMLLVLGEVSRGYASYQEALSYFEQALASFRTLHSKEGTASTLRDRGTVFAALGHYARALNDYEEAQRLFIELELRERQAWVLTDKSTVYADQGKLDSAAKLCNDALLLFREQGIRRGEGWALCEMGDIARKQHDLNRARTSYEEALAFFSALGDRVDQARVFNGLGATAFEEGNYLEAREQFEQGQAIAHEQGARQIDGRGLRGLGDVARAMQHFSDAEHYYQQAAAIATELGTPAEQRAVLHRQGLLMQAQGNYRGTLDCWVHALALDHRLEHSTRWELQQQIDNLVAEQHLEEMYSELYKKYTN